MRKQGLADKISTRFNLLLIVSLIAGSLFGQDKLDTQRILNKAKLFAFAEFDQFDTNEYSLYKTSIIESEGFKDVLFIKIEARNSGSLRQIAIDKILDSLEPGRDTMLNLLSRDTSEVYRKSIFKKYFGFDSITESNIEKVEKRIGEKEISSNKYYGECDYILAYTNYRYYLLKGFDNIQFKQFLIDCFNFDEIPSEIKKYNYFKGKNYTKILDKSLKVDEIDLQDYYRYFILHKGYYPQCEPCGNASTRAILIH